MAYPFNPMDPNRRRGDYRRSIFISLSISVLLLITALYVSLTKDTIPYLDHSWILTTLTAILLVIIGIWLMMKSVRLWKENDLDKG